MSDTAAQNNIDVPALENALPTDKELELEVMLHERNEQIVRLVNDIKLLRRHLPAHAQSKDKDDNGNDASLDESMTLPPSVLNLIAPIIASASPASQQPPTSSASSHTGTSATVTAALTARLSALQEENNELYGLLTSGTIGRLHEEVRLMQHGTKKLEAALKELGEAYRVIEARREDDSGSSGRAPTKRSRHSRSPSGSRSSTGYQPHRTNQSYPSQQYQGGSIGQGKTIPTGPRALKKPRLDDDDGSRQRGGRRAEYDGARPSEDWTRTNDDGNSVKASGGLRINGAARRGNDVNAGSERGWSNRDDENESGGRGRTGTRSRSRSPLARPYDASPRDRDFGSRCRISRSPSPLRMRSRTRSPTGSRNGPPRSLSRSPPPIRARSRSREASRSPPLRRSRSPSRIGRDVNSHNNNGRGRHSPRPMRRERERERIGASRRSPSPRQTEISRPNPRLVRERNRAAAGQQREAHPRNGASGAAPSNSKPASAARGQAQAGGGGSLMSRIK
ncbi:hypothetical protein FRB98_007390 [Tulasnella sp. 332]|nr:hypothetical protein FRB98_007390 [Tulasnella sp. 332]